MGRAEKSRRLAAREEIEQLASMLRLAYAADERASFNDLLDAIDQGAPGSAFNSVPRDTPETDR